MFNLVLHSVYFSAGISNDVEEVKQMSLQNEISVLMEKIDGRSANYELTLNGKINKDGSPVKVEVYILPDDQACYQVDRANRELRGADLPKHGAGFYQN